jgi:hypothetical protein
MDEIDEILLEPCIVCTRYDSDVWYSCDIDHKCDAKTMKFIEKARDVHGWRYGYEDVKYISGKKKVIITCGVHGSFEQTPQCHTRGGCRGCAGKDPETAEENFRKRIKELGGQVIGEYKSAHTPVKCRCSNGHICSPMPSNIQKMQGLCMICARNDPETAEANFRKRIKELGGQVIGEYNGVHIPVECRCSEGHTCTPMPSNIQKMQGMCKICSERDPKTAEENFRKSIEKLGGIVIGEYVGFNIPVECRCSQNHPCQPRPGGIRQMRGMCQRCSQKGYSKAQIEWLTHVANDSNIHLQHAENSSEFKIGPYKVDGYCEETRTVYEFHGDFWHGNPKFHDPEEIHPVGKKSFGQLFKNTLHKEMFLKRAGYSYVCIWEHEWNLFKYSHIF